MAITRALPDSQVAITFDKIHFVRMELHQPKFSNNALDPVILLKCWYREYGLDATNTRYYKQGEPVEIEITDIFALAKEQKTAGVVVFSNFLTAMERSIAKLIKEKIGIDTTVG